MFRLSFSAVFISLLAWLLLLDWHSLSQSTSRDIGSLDRVELSKKLRSILQNDLFNRDAQELGQLLYKIDKRSEMGRILVSIKFVEEQDFESFFKHYPKIIETTPLKAKQFVDDFSIMFQDPLFTEAVLKHIKERKPDWGPRILSRVNELKLLETEEILEYYAFYPESQNRLLKSLITRNDWTSAYQLFSEMADLAKFDVSDRPFNSSFKDFSVGSPFNWFYNEDYVDREADGVEISYFGRETPTFLQQYVPIDQGEYELQMEYSGDLSRDAGYFIWIVSCRNNNGGVLGRHEVTFSSDDDARTSFRFSLPDGKCNFLRLALSGRPGIFPGHNQIHIKTVKLVKL